MKISSLVFVVLLLSSPFASAGPISGTYYTPGGKLVNLQGLEWLPLSETAGLSRAQIETNFGNNNYLHEGWRYATREETALLIQSIWGGVSGSNLENGDGAQWFYGVLGGGPLFAQTNELAYFFYGEDGECSADPGVSCRGFYRVYYSNVSFDINGWFFDAYGASSTHLNPWTMPDDDPRYVGNLLVRELASVPAPAAWLLLLIGLVPILFKRRAIVALRR